MAVANVLRSRSGLAPAYYLTGTLAAKKISAEIIAVQIRDQGYACKNTLDAKRDN